MAWTASVIVSALKRRCGTATSRKLGNLILVLPRSPKLTLLWPDGESTICLSGGVIAALDLIGLKTRAGLWAERAVKAVDFATIADARGGNHSIADSDGCPKNLEKLNT